jgi:hypothetical protein
MRATEPRQLTMWLPTDLESTIRSIDGLLGHHDLVEREQGLISAGCVRVLLPDAIRRR